MPDEINIQRILAYVSQHRGDYMLEVLREQLLVVGYQPADIEAAFARLPQQVTPDTPPEVVDPVVQPSAPPSQIAATNSSPDTEAEIQRMMSYLRQHTAQYNSEALRAQLLATGQPPALVEAAIARVQAEQPMRKRAAWPLGLCVAILNILLLPLLLVMLTAAVDQLAPALALGGLLYALWPLTLVGELIAGLLLRGSPRDHLGRVLVYGVLFSIVIPIVLAILLFGICLIFLAGPSLFR